MYEGSSLPVIVGLAIGIGFVAMFAILSPFSMPSIAGNKQPQVSIVKIQSVLQDAPNGGFDRQVITVQIGVNNTVRWINADVVPHGIPTPGNETLDPAFTTAVEKGKEELHGFLLPNATFQYTFTKPGKFFLYMSPHPWMQDMVIVLPSTHANTHSSNPRVFPG